MATTVGVDRELGVPARAVPPEVYRRRRWVLLLLGTLTASVTFQAGLSPLGGLLSDKGGGPHIAGGPVYCNSTFFVALLAVALLLISSRNPVRSVRSVTSQGELVMLFTMLVALILGQLSLTGAFVAPRSLSSIALACVVALAASVVLRITIGRPVLLCKPVVISPSSLQESPQLPPWKKNKYILKVEQKSHQQQNLMSGQGSGDAYLILKRSRKHMLLLATLVATVTYEAGLKTMVYGEGTDTQYQYASGDDRILHDKRRYLVFFYCNASAFLVSLAIVLMLLLTDEFSPQKYHRALQAVIVVDLLCLIGAYFAVTLDWFCLIGAYVAGSIWQLLDPAYFTLLFALVSINVAIHIVVFLLQVLLSWVIWRQALREKMEQCLPDWLRKLFGMSTDGHEEEEEEDEDEEEDGGVDMELKLEHWRKLLLMLAILAAILAYHAISSPPPDNLVSYRRLAFSYCEATVFIASLSIIAMLANRNLPEARGVRWHAMRVCVILDVISLTGAFAARGYWKISTIDVLVLALAVLLCVAFHVALSIHGTTGGFVQSLVSNVRSPSPPVIAGSDPLQDGDTQHDFEVGLTGGTNEEPLAVEIASPILRGALTLIVAIPVISIVAIEVKLLVGIMIASIGVGLWRMSLARLLQALASALQLRQGTPPTGSSSILPKHGLCKLIHTLCSETWMWIIILVIWVPSLRHSLKLKFKLPRIFAVLGVLVDEGTLTPNTTTTTAASTTTTATLDTPSTATSTAVDTPNTAQPPGSSTDHEVQPLVELRPTRNRRANSRLIGPEWVN